jgi:SWI/SNF related-matrix-associated actin-dependent regulator of chromatin subfamily C
LLIKRELKISQFEELEEILEEERRGLESTRAALLQERVGVERVGVKRQLERELVRGSGGGSMGDLDGADVELGYCFGIR